jgi:hypothetical protein
MTGKRQRIAADTSDIPHKFEMFNLATEYHTKFCGIFVGYLWDNHLSDCWAEQDAPGYQKKTG